MVLQGNFLYLVLQGRDAIASTSTFKSSIDDIVANCRGHHRINQTLWVFSDRFSNCRDQIEIHILLFIIFIFSPSNPFLTLFLPRLGGKLSSDAGDKSQTKHQRIHSFRSLLDIPCVDV